MIRNLVAAAAAIITLAACGGAASRSLLPSSLLATDSSLRLAAASPYQVIYSFGSTGTDDGSGPSGGLVSDRGALYGTTAYGGPSHGNVNCGGVGCGTLFKLTPSGDGYTESVLYRFIGRPQQAPNSVIIDHGVFYGTLQTGGPADKVCSGGNLRIPNGCGSVYRIQPTAAGYSFQTIYQFPAGALAGVSPTLLMRNGSLFGTTIFGQQTVFQLQPSGSTFKKRIVYTFKGGQDGSLPSGVVADAKGNLYGTTLVGGRYGDGTVYKLMPKGSSYVETILYSFKGGNDGDQPDATPLLANGKLYGTTQFGGGGKGTGCYAVGCGTVFQLATSGSGYSVLYRFKGGTQGANPNSPLIRDPSGVLYGSTPLGGKAPNACVVGYCGIIFKLTPFGSTYKESVVFRLNTLKIGQGPSGLTSGPDGALFGENAYTGKPLFAGNVFRIQP